MTIHMEKNETGVPEIIHRLTKDLKAKSKTLNILVET